MERTTVYKTLLRLEKYNLVQITEKNKTKHFFIPSIKVIKNFIINQKEQLTDLEENYTQVESEFKKLDKKYKANIPKIRLFDNIDGVKNIFEDIYENTIENKFISIKFFASNVFQEQTGHNAITKDLTQNFFKKLKKKSITLDSFLGNGILIMEHVSRNSNIDLTALEHLPASNSAINMFIVGQSFYIIIFKDIPFGIKIDSEELVYSMHFLFDNLKTE